MQCLKEARRAELLLAFVLSQVLETCELPRAGRARDGATLGARAACSAVAVVLAVPRFAPETAVTGATQQTCKKALCIEQGVVLSGLPSGRFDGLLVCSGWQS